MNDAAERERRVREARDHAHPLIKLATLEHLLWNVQNQAVKRDQLGQPLTPGEVHDRVYEAITGLLEISPPAEEAGADRTQWMVAVVQGYRAGLADQSRATREALPAPPRDRNPTTEAELLALLDEWPPLMADAQEYARVLGVGKNIEVKPEYISVRVDAGRLLRVIFRIEDGRITGIPSAGYY